MEEHEVSSQMSEDILEVVVHPFVGLPIDEVQIAVVAASKTATFSGSNPLQGYIDRACSTTCPFLPIIGRGAGFLGQILLMDQTEQHELSMDQCQHSGLVPYIGVYAFDSFHEIDWREIMSWYHINGATFLVRGIMQQEPLDERVTACFSGQWDVDRQFISIPVALA